MKTAATRNLLIILMFTAVSAIAADPPKPIPDTGQTKCYDNTKEIPCPAPGEPFYGQDAQYTNHPRSYTLLQGGAIVQDNVTGLMWEAKQNLDGTTDYTNPHDADNTYTWYDPNPDTNGGHAGTESTNDTKKFIDALNTANFGGYSDWRMPTIKELASIVNLGRMNPAIDPLFVNTKSSGYWSSTTYAYRTGNAWGMYFGYGYDNDYHYGKSVGYYVRAVRGGQ